MHISTYECKSMKGYAAQQGIKRLTGLCRYFFQPVLIVQSAYVQETKMSQYAWELCASRLIQRGNNMKDISLGHNGLNGHACSCRNTCTYHFICPINIYMCIILQTASFNIIQFDIQLIHLLCFGSVTEKIQLHNDRCKNIMSLFSFFHLILNTVPQECLDFLAILILC